MNTMRCITKWSTWAATVGLCLGMLACTNTGNGTKQAFQAPLLTGEDDAWSKVDFQGNLDFGQVAEAAFSKAKPLTGYVFDALQGARVTVTLTVTNGEDPVLILYGPLSNKGIWGAPITLDDDGLDGLNSLISRFALPASGLYLAAVATYDGVADGSFELSLGCSGNCEEPYCPDVMCDLYCPAGFMTDENGCPICRCADAECQTDADCAMYDNALPMQCIDGACVPPDQNCTSDADCADGFHCEMLACPAICIDDGAGGCLPCPSEGVCVRNTFECNTDADCMAAGVEGKCLNGRCVNEGLACRSDAECPDSLVCQLGPCPMAPCGPDGECPEYECWGICVPPPPPTCQADADCPEGMTCAIECWGMCDGSTPDDPNGSGCFEECRGYCVPKQQPQCESDADCIDATGQEMQCINGMCVAEPIQCQANDDCPAGTECQFVCYDCVPEDPNCPGCVGYCVPVPQPTCASDADCIDESTNTQGHCVNGQCVFEEMRCTEDSECPPGYGCELIACTAGVENGDTSIPSTCYGVCVPDQATCRTDQDCQDAAGQQGHCVNGQCIFDGCDCPDVWAPVCAEVCYQTAIGCDATDPNCELPEPVCEQRTYSNECYARCAGAQVLFAGACEDPRPECDNDADCAPGYYCAILDLTGTTNGAGVCMPLPDMQCQADADCPDGFRCELGPCPLAPCTSDGECPECWGQCVPAESACIVTGCSGQICAPYPIDTTCVWLPEYECLHLTTCEMLYTDDGQQTCGWVENDAYLACLDNIHNADDCTSDADCPPGSICQLFENATGVGGVCVASDCLCPEYAAPVCGADNQTYDNICFLDCAGVPLLHDGACR